MIPKRNEDDSMRTVTLFIAMSLDGYIADHQGGTSWLEETSKGCMAGYDTFYQEIDTIIMGRTTYEQIKAMPSSWPYEDRMTYVLTHEPLCDESNICFINDSISNLLSTLQTQTGKGIWICGGAHVISQAMQSDLIDRYWITVMPILLGDGILLFQPKYPTLHLTLIEQTSYGNMMDLVYERKR